MSRATYDLLLAMRNEGCPICHVTRQVVKSYLDAISYESVNDVQVRERIGRALGYCAAHGREWMGLRDAIGTAMIYYDVLGRALKTLDAATDTTPARFDAQDAVGGLLGRVQKALRTGQEPKSWGAALADALEPAEACPACVISAETEQKMAAACAVGINNAEFAQALGSHASGLCLPHLRAVLCIVPDEHAARSLAAIQAGHLRKTREGLAEVIRKGDYRYRQEARGEESDTPARGVEQAGGSLPTQTNPPR
jgi:hypothetical protein